MNRCVIIGNLTFDPALRYVDLSGGQTAVCELNVAVNRRYGDREQTDYFRVTVWRGAAEACAKWLHKGSKICASGAVSTRAYVRRDGSAGASLEMTADEVEFLSSARQEGGGQEDGGNEWA